MLSQVLKSRPVAKVFQLAACISNGSCVNGSLQLRLLSKGPQVNHFSTDLKQQTKASVAAPDIIPQQDYEFIQGKQYHNFDCTRVEPVSEMGLVSYTFRHLGTGTELWHIHRKDSNSVFSINFRTTPLDSTGWPHILEHIVLSGSKKYSLRNTFCKMINRSVFTFMNAVTGSDYTMYPFSTMNETDYRNLQKIYLDAVFSPNLHYLDFLQEGWRLEHSNVHDKSSEYVLNGVVYNEMKGNFSENFAVFSKALLNNLLPDHTYAYISGGSPLEIPKLTHTQLVDYHAKYYHPSNARIYSYGNFDLMKTLKYVDGEYLSKYKAIDNSFSRVPSQPRWEKPRTVHVYSRYDYFGASFQKQNQIAIALLTCDVTDIQEIVVLELLGELLVHGPNSPFYKTLVEPNFSGGYNKKSGYFPWMKDTYFSVGLQDVRVEDFKKVEEIFDSTIKEAIEKGFHPDHVESVLHKFELVFKHQRSDFGKELMYKSRIIWNHDGDVVSNLHVPKIISKIRQNLLMDPNYLQHRVQHYFANNTHRLTLTMTPDPHHEQKFKIAEAAVLNQQVMSLDNEKREEIYKNGLKLEKVQKAEQNLDILPCLKLDDVLKTPKVPAVEVYRICNVPTQVCQVQTNDIFYLKLCFSGAHLSLDEVMLIPLLCGVINAMGTKKHDHGEFDKRVLLKTDGFDFQMHFAENIYDSKSFLVGLYMTTHALEKNVPDMFSLCTELLTEYKFEDVEKLRMLIDRYISKISVGIVYSGNSYAMQSCAGLVTNAAKLKSQLEGLEHIEYMKNLVKTRKTEEIMEKLKSLGSKIFIKNAMRCALNTSAQFYPAFLKHYDKFLSDMPVNKDKPEIYEHDVKMLQPSRQHFVMDISVNYCAKSFFAAPYTHPDHPMLRLLAKFLSAKYLLPVVRDRNGAYGAGAKIGLDGIFSFNSYRDPNCIKTLRAFDNTYQWLQEHNEKLTEQALLEAKLGVLQQLDAPVSPGNVGMDLFLYGVSHDMLADYRGRMLSVTVDRLRAVLDRYFKNEPLHFGQCVLGPANRDLKEGKNKEWKIITNTNE